MNRKKIFWEEVAGFIQKHFRETHPSTRPRKTIREFLNHLEKTILERTKDNEQLAEICRVTVSKDGFPKWNPIGISTMEKLFRYKSTKGDPYTCNIFAVYIGYLSYENYITIKYPLNNITKAGTPNDPVSVVMELKNADFYKEDTVDEWMIYEMVFLWFGKEPPSIQAHFYQMTREMQFKKRWLHKSVEDGLLEAKTEVFPNGVTRYVTREALEKFIKDQQLEKPNFLKKEQRRS